MLSPDNMEKQQSNGIPRKPFAGITERKVLDQYRNFGGWDTMEIDDDKLYRAALAVLTPTLYGRSRVWKGSTPRVAWRQVLHLHPQPDEL